MKIINTALFLLLSVTINTCAGGSGRDVVLIENEIFTKHFNCDALGPGAIQPEYRWKKEAKTLNQSAAPYFEFVINGKVISSDQSLWTFKEMKERLLQNGGTEYTLEFSGTAGHVMGLNLSIVQQIFPGSTLVREKLILQTGEKEFRLNKKEGELHFRFPQYLVKEGKGLEAESVEIRIASWEQRPVTFGDEVSGNHMYYPVISHSQVTPMPIHSKGPINIVSTDSLSWLTAYEHASQDNRNGLLDQEKLGTGNFINDAMQGTKGVFNFPVENEDFRFLGISTQRKEDLINISIDALRGTYLDGELIDPQHPYETVWTATAFYNGRDLDKGKEIIRNYLLNQICENPASRKPEYYYNTWGMQRENRSRPLRGILTYKRIFEEIEYAAQLGVDIFVLDDGWEQAQGDWTPHYERLPQGLGPVKEKLDEYDIKMGLWFSPMGIDSTTVRYREHPEWVIKDSEGNPIQAQWGHPAFDFVSDFSNLFIEDCKRLIDQGCLFMKWDAINTFYSTLSGLQHGSSEYTKEEIRARYEYLLPIYVVKAMETLTAYEPELVIEIDLTEARRVMMGLAPLSQGKLFFMNNGASTYNDYSAYRTKSMRTIANEYSGLIPLELFTYASYPHDQSVSMLYNVNSSLLAGHGFWGDLSLMTESQKAFVGRQIRTSKRVLPYITESEPAVLGRVGDSPEVYSIINSEKAVGQIISFSEEPSHYSFEQDLNTGELLAVLNNPYDASGNRLKMDLVYESKESTSAIFVLPNHGSGISIISSTTELNNVRADQQSLSYEVNEPGIQLIRWPGRLGEPLVDSRGKILFDANKEGDGYTIRIEPADKQKTFIELSASYMGTELVDWDKGLMSPVLFAGDSVTAYRDPAVIFDGGIFYLFFTLVEIEPDSMIYSYTAMSTSRNLKDWSGIKKITPKDQQLNFSSPGNVIRFGNEWILCLQTYPRPGYHASNMPVYGDNSARLFIMRSNDLKTWTKPELLKVKGPDVPIDEMGRMIDPYLVRDIQDSAKIWCFYKQNGVSMSWSYDLENWTFHGNTKSGENVCVLKDNDEYILFHSPSNGIGVKRSKNLDEWADWGELITLGQSEWLWARGRITAGAVVDMRDHPDIQRYLMFFHGSGPGDEKTDFDRNSSIGIAWSEDLRNWNWP